MRPVALLLLCLGLSACAAGGFPGEQPAPVAAAAPPPAHSGGGGGARGGASTAAARAAADPDAPTPSGDPVTQARADCWMKVEGQKALRGIDQRIGFVDKCVARELKDGPTP
jgi:hypothetical protein